LSAEGHRVVIAVATDGVMGESTGASAQVRLDELRASASVLGVARVLHLGYADSGWGSVLYPDPVDRVRFCRADVDEAVRRLADLLHDERADVLLSYDRRGGYGHRDHVKVHEVGARAAEMMGTVRVLEATLPREPLVRLLDVMRVLRLPLGHELQAIRSAYSPRSAITHRVDVRPVASQKRAALAAHRSQLGKVGRASQVLRLLVGLPTPIFGLLLGREWFIEPGSAPPRRQKTMLGPATAGSRREGSRR
jgi:LmbE family N-acetylglucosaminyl deacetylase